MQHLINIIGCVHIAVRYHRHLGVNEANTHMSTASRYKVCIGVEESCLDATCNGVQHLPSSRHPWPVRHFTVATMAHYQRTLTRVQCTVY